jgi:hypothetical protein
MAVTMADAEMAFRSWINSQTTTLVGVGKPLVKGALLNRMHGAASVPYALISLESSGITNGHENPDQVATITAELFGSTKESAALAAAAYVEALVTRLTGASVAVPGATILAVDNISGPSWLPNAAEPRYIVRADITLRPA